MGRSTMCVLLSHQNTSKQLPWMTNLHNCTCYYHSKSCDVSNLEDLISNFSDVPKCFLSNQHVWMKTTSNWRASCTNSCNWCRPSHWWPALRPQNVRPHILQITVSARNLGASAGHTWELSALPSIAPGFSPSHFHCCIVTSRLRYTQQPSLRYSYCLSLSVSCRTTLIFIACHCYCLGIDCLSYWYACVLHILLQLTLLNVVAAVAVACCCCWLLLSLSLLLWLVSLERR